MAGPRRKKITPKGIRRGMKASDLIDETFLAYNAGRLGEAASLLAGRILEENVTVAWTLSGALTPAGLGRSCLVPLMKAGFVDWMTSTGANLYHDAHHALGMKLRKGSPFSNDLALREEGLVRIYDILLRYDDLIRTDSYIRHVMGSRAFRGRRMGTAEIHYELGKFLLARERKLGIEDASILATAHRLEIPVYCPAFGDSANGMNVALLNLMGRGPDVDISLDVNETAGIVFDAKASGGKTAVIILGGGTPKNFALQTEPHIQEILGIAQERIGDDGADYFIQVTDARPDTGGLSGATPSEAVSWGKIDPDALPRTVVAYLDVSIGLPLLTAYCLDRAPHRRQKRLFRRRGEIIERVREALDIKKMMR